MMLYISNNLPVFFSSPSPIIRYTFSDVWNAKRVCTGIVLMDEVAAKVFTTNHTQKFVMFLS